MEDVRSRNSGIPVAREAVRSGNLRRLRIIRVSAAGLYSFPTTYVVDKNGNIVGQPIVGAITAPDQAKKLNELIDQALASSK